MAPWNGPNKTLSGMRVTLTTGWTCFVVVVINVAAAAAAAVNVINSLCVDIVSDIQPLPLLFHTIIYLFLVTFCCQCSCFNAISFCRHCFLLLIRCSCN